MRHQTGLLAFCLLLGLNSFGVASIEDLPDQGGYGFFRDSNTGRTWLDMDNFFQASTDTMVTTANGLGFTFATKSDVQQLLGSLPLGSGQWSTYKSIMMDAPNRELIWGAYDDQVSPTAIHGWAYAFDYESSWQYVDNAVAGSDVPNSGSFHADMNIWAYKEAGAVPEPISLAIWSVIGVAGIGLNRLRRSKK